MGDHVYDPNEIGPVGDKAEAVETPETHSTPRTVGEWVKSAAKAFVAMLAAAVALLAVVVVGDETLRDVTTQEWLIVIAGVLGTFGITYRVPNKGTFVGR